MARKNRADRNQSDIDEYIKDNSLKENSPLDVRTSQVDDRDSTFSFDDDNIEPDANYKAVKYIDPLINLELDPEATNDPLENGVLLSKAAQDALYARKIDSLEGQKGIIEIASQTQVDNGTNDTNSVTPLKLSQKLGDAFNPLTNIIYLNANGFSGTPVKGDINKPYQTFSSALSAVSDNNDIIYVLGYHTTTSQLHRDGATLRIHLPTPNDTIEFIPDFTSMIAPTGDNSKFIKTGGGSIIQSGSAGPSSVIMTSFTNTEFTIKGGIFEVNQEILINVEKAYFEPDIFRGGFTNNQMISGGSSVDNSYVRIAPKNIEIRFVYSVSPLTLLAVTRNGAGSQVVYEDINIISEITQTSTIDIFNYPSTPIGNFVIKNIYTREENINIFPAIATASDITILGYIFTEKGELGLVPADDSIVTFSGNGIIKGVERTIDLNPKTLARRVFKTVQIGNWEDSSTFNILLSDGSWVEAHRVPSSTDVLFVEATHTVTINENQEIYDIWYHGAVDVKRLIFTAGSSKELAVWNDMFCYTGDADNPVITTNTNGSGTDGWLDTNGTESAINFVGLQDRTILSNFTANSRVSGWHCKISALAGAKITTGKTLRVGWLTVASGIFDTLNEQFRPGGFDTVPSAGGGALSSKGGVLVKSGAEFRTVSLNKSTSSIDGNQLEYIRIEKGGVIRANTSGLRFATDEWDCKGTLEVLRGTPVAGTIVGTVPITNIPILKFAYDSAITTQYSIVNDIIVTDRVIVDHIDGGFSGTGRIVYGDNADLEYGIDTSIATSSNPVWLTGGTGDELPRDLYVKQPLVLGLNKTIRGKLTLNDLGEFDINGNVFDQDKEINGVAISTNYTTKDKDLVIVTTGASDVTITLPPVALNLKTVIRVQKTDNGSGNVIVDGEGAEEINGSLTATITTQYTVLTLYCDGVEWFII